MVETEISLMVKFCRKYDTAFNTQRPLASPPLSSQSQVVVESRGGGHDPQPNPLDPRLVQSTLSLLSVQILSEWTWTPDFRLTRTTKCPIILGSRLWNELPKGVQDAGTYPQFKHKVKEHFNMVWTNEGYLSNPPPPLTIVCTTLCRPSPSTSDVYAELLTEKWHLTYTR